MTALPKVVQQVLLLPEDVPADVATVLDSARVDGDVLLEAVEAGELPAADGAHEKAAVVLNGGRGVGDVRNRIFKIKFMLIYIFDQTIQYVVICMF